MSKPKNICGTIQLIVRWDKEVHTFPNGISPKVNVMVRLEFELIYYDVTVQQVNNSATETSSLNVSGENNQFRF